MAQNKEDFNVLKKYSEMLWHVHIAEPNERTVLGEESREFIKQCFDALKNANYDKGISFERYHAPDYCGAEEMLKLFSDIWQEK